QRQVPPGPLELLLWECRVLDGIEANDVDLGMVALCRLPGVVELLFNPAHAQGGVDFFEGGSLGYSVTAKPNHFDGLELRSFNWQVQPLTVDKVESSFALFPVGSVEFDCALLMRGIEHEWLCRGRLCA